MTDVNETLEKKTGPVLILGIGNILLSDEGAGVKAVEMIKAYYDLPRGIDTLDGGTIGMELLPYLSGRSLVILVDAVKSGQAPGTVVKIEDLPAYFQNRTSPHQIGLLDVLAFSELSGDPPPKTLLFGIEPQSLDTGIGLSPRVQAKLPYLVEKIIEELEGRGFEIRLR